MTTYRYKFIAECLVDVELPDDVAVETVMDLDDLHDNLMEQLETQYLHFSIPVEDGEEDDIEVTAEVEIRHIRDIEQLED